MYRAGQCMTGMRYSAAIFSISLLWPQQVELELRVNICSCIWILLSELWCVEAGDVRRRPEPSWVLHPCGALLAAWQRESASVKERQSREPSRWCP